VRYAVFTGLIEEIGSVTGVRKSGDGAIIHIRCADVLQGTRIGDSISINGACQTVTDIGDGFFSAFASRVTLSVTTLGRFRQGTRVNLERALSPQSRLGGHIVQGHVDGKGIVSSVDRDSRGSSYAVSCGRELSKYIVGKGSVAVDGISLTVVSAHERGFSLYLIPESLDKTTAGDWKNGDEVNIEVDILAKYVEKMLSVRDENETEARDLIFKKKLIEEGFV